MASATPSRPRWAVSDPALADSDGDGLIDAAEDPDGDDLGGLGEQRYGTDPGDSDSDGDGVSDGREDSDGDGRTDAQQQDERRAPERLRPSIEEAWWDRSENYDDRCHNDAVDPELHPCSFGAPDGATHVVLFGDSHALQWLPALAAAGSEAGWRVTALTKAACPPSEVEFGRKEVGAAASCSTWRGRALDWLASESPDVVLLTGAGRVYNLLDARGQRLSDEAALAAWRQGLAAILEALPEGSAAVVLADTPLMRRNPVSCLEADPSDLSACATPRALAIEDGLDEAERETADPVRSRLRKPQRPRLPLQPLPGRHRRRAPVAQRRSHHGHLRRAARAVRA